MYDLIFNNYFIFLLLPLVLLVIQILTGKNENLRDVCTILFTTVTALLIISYVSSFSNTSDTFNLASLAPNLSIAFRLDGLGAIFLFVAGVLWCATSIYSLGYMRTLKEHAQTRFYVFFCLALFSVFGVALSANLLTLYLFYECLSFSTYPLVAHHQDAEAKAGARKYLSYILGPSLCLALPALAIIYVTTGSLDFNSLGLMADKVPSSLGVVLFLMCIYGYSKAALIPFHSWLPGAMVAPTPVSSLLHAVAVVKVGVFSVLRVTHDIFGLEYLSSLSLFSINFSTFLCIIAAVSIIFPSLVALSQDNLKRRLAFSTIGQLAYITMGAVLLTDLAVASAGVHIAMHAFSKITLFFCVGAIYVATKKKYISEISGFAYKMPVTFSAFAIGAAGVVGIPLTGGFITKWNLLLGALESQNQWVVAIYLISSLLSAFYLFEVVFVALKNKPEGKIEIKEAPLFCLIPIVFTAGMTIALFFISDSLFSLAYSWVGL